MSFPANTDRSIKAPLTFDPETAMSSSVLMATQVTSWSCPQRTCTGRGDRPLEKPPCRRDNNALRSSGNRYHTQTASFRGKDAAKFTCCTTCHTMQEVSLEPEMR